MLAVDVGASLGIAQGRKRWPRSAAYPGFSHELRIAPSPPGVTPASRVAAAAETSRGAAAAARGLRGARCPRRVVDPPLAAEVSPA
jgi:hypothetical protein